jgi:hypothetical protein
MLNFKIDKAVVYLGKPQIIRLGVENTTPMNINNFSARVSASQGFRILRGNYLKAQRILQQEVSWFDILVDVQRIGQLDFLFSQINFIHGGKVYDLSSGIISVEAKEPISITEGEIQVSCVASKLEENQVGTIEATIINKSALTLMDVQLVFSSPYLSLVGDSNPIPVPKLLASAIHRSNIKIIPSKAGIVPWNISIDCVTGTGKYQKDFHFDSQVKPNTVTKTTIINTGDIVNLSGQVNLANDTFQDTTSFEKDYPSAGDFSHEQVVCSNCHKTTDTGTICNYCGKPMP